MSHLGCGEIDSYGVTAGAASATTAKIVGTRAKGSVAVAATTTV